MALLMHWYIVSFRIDSFILCHRRRDIASESLTKMIFPCGYNIHIKFLLGKSSPGPSKKSHVILTWEFSVLFHQRIYNFSCNFPRKYKARDRDHQLWDCEAEFRAFQKIRYTAAKILMLAPIISLLYFLFKNSNWALVSWKTSRFLEVVALEAVLKNHFCYFCATWTASF